MLNGTFSTSQNAISRDRLADIALVPTGEGELDLAGVLRWLGRKLVGWAMPDHIATVLGANVLQMAFDDASMRTRLAALKRSV